MIRAFQYWAILIALLLSMVGIILAVVWISASTVRAQEGAPCIPYDVAIQRLASGGFTILEPIDIVPGATVDFLLIAEIEGYVMASRVIDGCVVTESIPLGLLDPVKDKGVPS